MLYEKALLDRWTAYAVKKTAQEKLKEAMKEGMEKGLKKGMEEGMEKGMEKSKEQFVKNLISKFGFTDEQTTIAAEVPADFVKKIRDSLKKKK